MQQTPLDIAHAAMFASGDAAAPRAALLACLGDTELILLLADQTGAPGVTPEIFDTSDGRFAIAFDTQERLADFAKAVAHCVTLPGRVLSAMLTEADLGLALNPGVAPSSHLFSTASLAWLNDTLNTAPRIHERTVTEIFAPNVETTDVLRALDHKLAKAAGLASHAALARVAFSNGDTAHIVGFLDPVPGAEGALARAVNQALTFADAAGTWEVGFFGAETTIGKALILNGIVLNLPQRSDPVRPAAPGSDPDKPPILKYPLASIALIAVDEVDER